MMITTKKPTFKKTIAQTLKANWDIIAKKYVYIPENVWYSFTEKARSRYTEERI